MRPFAPIFRNPHLLTIAGNYWRRNLDTARFPVSERFFQTEPGVKILVHSQQPEAPPLGDLILVHGLEGSSNAGYAQSAAQAALLAGYAVHRFNMRSCGGTEAVCGATLYHSGQTSDLLSVIRQLRIEGRGPVFLTGYSLGGNVVLKLAGELEESGQALIGGVCAVSTPIDLAACAERLGHRSNILYARRFLARLKARVSRKEQLSPGTFDLSNLDNINTIYDFDNEFTSVSFGFGTASRYYATQSAQNFLERIRVPTLVVQAKDDPLIPFRVYNHPAFERNPCLKLVAVERGGHLGFLSRHKPRFWLDELMVGWLHEIRNINVPDFVS
ncbi:MAG TPA: alpha/beta fold hydrolase [Bryobacteraceae bacterium]|nr:alpha/beta fold hydrolase [Bryobacteraceae bacterium]